MFEQPTYWAVLLLVAAVCQFVPAPAMRVRAAIIGIGSAMGVWLLTPLQPIHWAMLALAILWLLVGLRRVIGRQPKRPFVASLVLCAPLLVVWVAGKGLATSQSRLTQLLLFVGISYLLIKAFTLAKDACDGRVREAPPLTVLAYLLFFPTFVAGPMHLYGEFENDLREPSRVDAEGAVDIVFRFLLGLVKVHVVVPLLQPMSLLGLTDAASVSAPKLAAASGVFSLLLLADFSGYSDMAIATSRWLGLRVPENFNWPYFAANIREFWQGWHITFSRVLTAYLFIPLTRSLQRALAGRRLWILFTGYTVTFAFCGYWHGAGTNYLLWGLYHAGGLFALDAWKALRPPSAPVLPDSGMTLRRVLSAAVTFVFVSLGWLLFALPLSRLLSLLT